MSRKFVKLVNIVTNFRDIAKLIGIHSRNVSEIRHDVHKLVRWQEGTDCLHINVVAVPITNDDLDNETRTILRWLSSKNFWLQQADLSNQRQPGTGQWILQNLDFLEWAGGNKDTIL